MRRQTTNLDASEEMLLRALQSMDDAALAAIGVTHFYLSFCDPTLPEGSQFLGACIVPGTTLTEAIANARRRGCHPGGEVCWMPIHPESGVPHSKWVGRLLSQAEVDEFGRMREADRRRR